MFTNQLVRCDRHPDEEARLTCGECGKRICTICMTLTGEGPRCQECMAQLNGGTAPAPALQGVVLPAGEEVARQDSAREAYYATEKVVYCARHPEVETGLRCGRCDTPICPRCMVHADVGIRCPDCAANPQRTFGRKVEQEAAAARGQAAPRDTGFRNYWYNNRAYQKILPQHYLLAALAGLGTALVLGVVWGFLMEGTFRRAGTIFIPEGRLLVGGRGGITPWANLISTSIQSSVHLLPEIAVGLLVAGAIARVTQGRVGPGLQLIAGLSVFFGIFVSTLTVAARIYQNATGAFPAVDTLISNSWTAITQQLGGGGIGVLVFWAIGIVLAVLRLKR
ncbi:MAG TPA: B-box zinc finger protein [Chloroflexia bacterium]|nr:B-box zinc finger protein [Chloroflexia bacterium]